MLYNGLTEVDMKFLLHLFLATALWVTPLFAEVIGSVQYYLPSKIHDWKVSREIKNAESESKTIIYIPEDVSENNAKAFFSAYQSTIPFKGFDMKTLERWMQVQYPDNYVHVILFETEPFSVTFEWYVKDRNIEIAHGWTRVFSKAHQTVLLSYQTTDIDSVPYVRHTVVDALSAADFIK